MEPLVYGLGAIEGSYGFFAKAPRITTRVGKTHTAHPFTTLARHDHCRDFKRPGHQAPGSRTYIATNLLSYLRKTCRCYRGYSFRNPLAYRAILLRSGPAPYVALETLSKHSLDPSPQRRYTL